VTSFANYGDLKPALLDSTVCSEHDDVNGKIAPGSEWRVAIFGESTSQRRICTAGGIDMQVIKVMELNVQKLTKMECGRQLIS